MKPFTPIAGLTIAIIGAQGVRTIVVVSTG
jgi:hypothetical protein